MKKMILGIIAFTMLSEGALLAQDIVGSWQGTLHAQSDLRTVIKIAKVEGGVQKATLYSIDQGAMGISATVTRQGSTVKTPASRRLAPPSNSFASKDEHLRKIRTLGSLAAPWKGGLSGQRGKSRNDK